MPVGAGECKLWHSAEEVSFTGSTSVDPNVSREISRRSLSLNDLTRSEGRDGALSAQTTPTAGTEDSKFVENDSDRKSGSTLQLKPTLERKKQVADVTRELATCFQGLYSYGSVVSERRRYQKRLTPSLPKEGYLWNVRFFLRFARNLPRVKPFSEIDPYVKVTYRNKTQLRSRTVTNNRNPIWDETFAIMINNLDYPLELDVYHGDSLKKDLHIGGIIARLNCIPIDLEQEFKLPIIDTKNQYLVSDLGSLLFYITISEVPHMNKHKNLLKQLRNDRQFYSNFLHSTNTPVPLVELPPLRVPSPTPPAVYTVPSQYTYSSVGSVYGNGDPVNLWDLLVEDDEESTAAEDEWLQGNRKQFYQPNWPVSFFVGTKVDHLLRIANAKMANLNGSNINSVLSNQNDSFLEQYFNRARLIVSLVRAELCETDLNHQASHHGKPLLATPQLQKMVAGRPLHRGNNLPSPKATLTFAGSWKHSHTIKNTFNPYWHQEFEFRFKASPFSLLLVEITDDSLLHCPVLLKSHLDISKLMVDWTGYYTLKNLDREKPGFVVVLVTLTGLTGQPNDKNGPSSLFNSLLPLKVEYRSPGGERDSNQLFFGPDVLQSKTSSASIQRSSSAASVTGSSPTVVRTCDQYMTEALYKELEDHYSFKRTMENVSDVGWLHVLVQGARNLPSPDRFGKIDPYCVLRLVNRCVHTSTVYRTIDPTWSESFVFPISDIYDVLQITIFDEDKKTLGFVGGLILPLTQLVHRKRRWYALKNSHLIKASKGCILLETRIIYNPVRAAIRSTKPREQPFVWPQNRVRLRKLLNRYVPILQKRMERLMPYFEKLAIGGQLLSDLYNWDSWLHSSLALIGLSVVIFYIEPYMVPFGAFLLLLSCYPLSLSFFHKTHHSPPPTTITENDENESSLFEEDAEYMDEYSNEDNDLIEKKKKRLKKNALKLKLDKARTTLGIVQTVVEAMASYAEKIDGLFRWRVPALNGVIVLMLMLGTILFCLVPTRYILIFYVIKKFTKRLRGIHSHFNLPLSIISRIPDRLQMVQHRELRPPTVYSTTLKAD